MGGVLRALVRTMAGALLVALAWIAVGGAMSAASGAPPLRGEMVDIGGRRLRLVCEGPAAAPGPLVVLEAGAFGFAADWAAVQDRLAAEGVRSCAYDRAGMGFSDPGPSPRDGLATDADLHALLTKAGLPAPYILVGHSMAGLRVRLFARRHPGEVAGLVLVDAASPAATETSEFRHFVGAFVGVSRLAAFGASAGLLKPVAFMGDAIGLPPAAAAEKRWAFANGRHNRTSAQEVEAWMATAHEAEGPLDPDLPVAVVSAGHGRGGFASLQAEPARRARRGYDARVEGASHASLLGLRFCGEIVKAIDFVRAAALERAAGPGAA